VETGVFDTRALYFRQSAAESRTGNQVDWTPGEWRHHMDCHWFGIEDENRNRVDPAAVPNYAGAASWWINFWGDNVQDIMRETVLRAIECAYGVKHGDPLTSATRTPWPVEFFWKCGQAWFEGWVTWKRATPSGSLGQVTALLCTPSENSGTHYVWDSPIPDPSDAVGTSDPYNRTDHLGLEHAGMVVVTHTTNTPVGMAPNQIAMQQSGGLVPPLPGAAFHGQGPIVAVRPAEFRGWEVPEVLRSGNHARIARWRRAMALRRTIDHRPDLIELRGGLRADDRKLLVEFGLDALAQGEGE